MAAKIIKHGKCELKEMGQVVLQIESSGSVLINSSLKDEKKVKKITCPTVLIHLNNIL